MNIATEFWRWLWVHPVFALCLMLAGALVGVFVMCLCAVAGGDTNEVEPSPVLQRMERMTEPSTPSGVRR